MPLKKVIIEIQGDDKKLDSTIAKLRKLGKVDKANADSFKKTSKSVGSGFDSLKKKAISLGATMLGAFAIKQVVMNAINILKDFEKEMSTLQSITGSTTEQMEFFRLAAINVGKSTKTAATEVVKAFTQIGSAQPELLKNSRALAEVTKQSLILSKAAGIDATSAAKALTGAMNQFGAKAKDAAKFTDIFATSQQKGSSFIADTSEALVNAGASAAAAGLSFETTNAAIQALAKGAITGARAGTALRGVLSKLSKQSDDSINPSMVGLTNTINELSKRNLTLKDATQLVGEEGAAGLLTMIKQRDILNELDGSLNDVGNAMEQMAINTDNVDGSMNDLGNAWESFIISVVGGEGSISKVLKRVLDWATDILDVLTSINEFGEIVPKAKQEDLIDTADNMARVLSEKIFEQIKSGAKTTEEALSELQSSMEKKQKKLNEMIEDGSKPYSGMVLALRAQIMAREDVIDTIKEQLAAETDLSDLTTKKTISGIDALRKRISELNKELLNQALAGKISEKTIDELEAATSRLARAEVDLLIAMTNTLPMKAAKLELLKIDEDGYDERAKLLSDWRQQQEDAAQQEMMEDRTKNELKIALASSAFNLFSVLQDRKLAKIDKEKNAKIAALAEQRDAELITEEEFAKRKEAIEEKVNAKRKEILTRQAKLKKLADIAEATANTAVAFTAHLKESPVVAAFIAALGLAEVASIAAQPIPEFHKGKKPELKEGEIYAKILKTEAVIPPEQSKAYKGAIDSMIDKKFEHYVFHEYMLPMIRNMSRGEARQYDDIKIWTNQRKQIRLTRETNELLKNMRVNYNPRRSWR